jgi:hypothetical protein
MANRFYSPNQQFADNTGTPYAGGSLAFYASGTSTPLATYSDSALTIANTNPVVLDSAGRAGNIFLQNLAYKVVLSDVNNNVIWTDDPVYSSDYSTRAKLLTGSGNPNGSVAGTAGSAGIGADAYWDATNNILYVCTTTGNAASAVWTAVNATATSVITPTPQGYLTTVSAQPIITNDSIGAASIFYTPYLGNLVSVYSGSSFATTTFSELTLTLSGSHAANTIYDVFVFSNSGTLTLATGPAWTSSTAGACARGTGAGTTQLSRLNGLLVNTVQMTGRNGSTTYTITANQGTYLGSILITATPGTVTCHRLYGQSRVWGVWNAYNRVPTFLKCGDSTASWTTGTVGFRLANNSAANVLTIFSGLAEEVYDLSYSNLCGSNGADITSGTIFSASVGVGINGVVSGRTGTGSLNNQSAATPFGATHSLEAKYISPPLLGINTIGAYEANGGGVVNIYNGTEPNMLLSAKWRA